jgi:hypothetical protein
MVRAAALSQEPPSRLPVFDNPGYQTRSWHCSGRLMAGVGWRADSGSPDPRDLVQLELLRKGLNGRRPS